jgi:hypothetical protein
VRRQFFQLLLAKINLPAIRKPAHGTAISQRRRQKKKKPNHGD